MGSNAWDRATFIAIRDRLLRPWQPRHEGESMFLDEMAQYEMLRLGWLKLAAEMLPNPEMLRSFLKINPNTDKPRPFNAADATSTAMLMAERFHRLLSPYAAI